VYAHRGDRSRAADNTLEAYALAVEAGADGIELDVRRTADGELVLAHDPQQGDLPPFADLTFDELRESDPSVPTLEEMLEAVPPAVYLNVEIKNSPFEAGFDGTRSIVDQTLETIAQRDDLSRILLSSFDAPSVHRARELAPDLHTGLLVVSSVPLDAAIDAAHEIGSAAVHPPMDGVDDDVADAVARVRRAGLAIVVWGANTATDVRQLTDAGADVIITDDPAMARSVIDQR
jgi:glycerophosphoryl diester phosphodiesterase